MHRPGLFLERLTQIRTLSSAALAWVIGAYSALFGAMLLVIPHVFVTSGAPSLLPTRFLGAALLTAGVLLLGVAAFAPRWSIARVAHAVAAIGLALLAATLAASGAWMMSAAHLVLAAGLAVA